MSTTDSKKVKSYSGLALVLGILSIILTVAFSSACVVMDLTGVLSRSVTAGLVFAGMIFGIIGIYTSCISHATVQKNKPATIGLICSITSVLLCVYSFFLYSDMVYWWTNILNAVAPNVLS